MLLETEIRNSKGEKVLLNEMEQRAVALSQEKVNALGYEINITSLTAIVKSIVEQKFYTVRPTNYLPVRVGEGAFAQELTTYRSFSLGGSFETGVINTGANNSRLAQANTGVDSITVPIINWGFEATWSIFDLQLASRSGNWDVVTGLEKARKKEWDLGIQQTAFLGMASNTNVKGLLTQADVTSNTSLITGYLSTMSASTFNSFLQQVLAVYQTNAQFTAFPTHFIIPQKDYNGLAAPSSETYPLKTKLELMTDAFRTITMNPNFQILPLAYADASNNASVGLNKNRYTLLNFDSDSIRMDIPVDYSTTVANSLDNFRFQNVGYGQFTGAKAYRPLEMLYFDF